MERVGKGLLAGLIATVVLSALMVMKSMMGIMPGLDLAKMISGMMGQPDTPAIGWAVHFMIGIVVYGLAISIWDGRTPGHNHVTMGLVLAGIGWLIMMVVLMPMAGAGVFGMTMGMMAPVMTFVLHMIFGWVLGGTYGWLLQQGHHPTGAAA